MYPNREMRRTSARAEILATAKREALSLAITALIQSRELSAAEILKRALHEELRDEPR